MTEKEFLKRLNRSCVDNSFYERGPLEVVNDAGFDEFCDYIELDEKRKNILKEALKEKYHEKDKVLAL